MFFGSNSIPFIPELNLLLKKDNTSEIFYGCSNVGLKPRKMSIESKQINSYCYWGFIFTDFKKRFKLNIFYDICKNFKLKLMTNNSTIKGPTRYDYHSFVILSSGPALFWLWREELVLLNGSKNLCGTLSPCQMEDEL